MVSACLEAYRTTVGRLVVRARPTGRSTGSWLERPRAGALLPRHGGCRDALHVDRVNGNQGAESTLAFLLSLAEMRIIAECGDRVQRAGSLTPHPPLSPVAIRRSGLVLHPDRARVLAPAAPSRESPAHGQDLRSGLGPPPKRGQGAAPAGGGRVRGTARADSGVPPAALRPGPALAAPRPDRSRTSSSCCWARTSPDEYSLEAAALSIPPSCPTPTSRTCPRLLRFILSLRATARGTSLDHVSHRILGPGRHDHRQRSHPLLPGARPDSERAVREDPCSRGSVRSSVSPETLPVMSWTAWGMRSRWTSCAPPSASRLPDGSAVTKRAQAVPGRLWRWPSRTTRCSSRRSHVCPSAVLFPVTPSQRNGIEDARFVRFQNEDGTRTYYATYTAYDGKLILPQFIETPDFRHFKFITPERSGRTEQGHGPLPPQDRGPICDAGPSRLREHLRDVLGAPSFLAHRRAPSPTGVPVGVHPDRQLRLTDRDRSRLACVEPRGGPDAEILHRRFPAPIATTRPGSSAACGSLSSSRARTSARATCQTSSTRAAVSCTAGRS